MNDVSQKRLAFLALVVLLAPLPPAAFAETNLDLARQLNEAFVEVVEKVSPSVVVINVVEKPGALNADSIDEQTDAPRGKSRPQKSEKTFGQGSGVILRKDGYILTNNHVVEDAEKIEVKLRDGRTLAAQVRGRDPASDLAVLKVDARDLPVARFADSAKIRVGEFAIAIGAPFSLDYSVTFGHVSAKGRSNVVPDWEDGGAMDQDFVQTDANINPGNSGGPLLNIQGEVIGINTLIRGLHTGIGFAIPSNLAREISEKLISDGKITRPWLGIKTHSIDDDPDFHDLEPEVDAGVIVQGIIPGSPAAKSGLLAADVIRAIDGKPIGSSQQLRNELRKKTVGQLVTLETVRGGKILQLKVKPEEELDVAGAGESPDNVLTASLGLTVQNVTHRLAEHFGVSLTEGVVVVAVDKGGPAARDDIHPGDVITAVNQQPVSTLKQFNEALRKADIKKGVLLNLTSRDELWFDILRADQE